ncbi:MAG: cellulase family glycosylhydrolase, partial [Candidatus Lokiarchaeota archaeon]|nr:cellulase family glycosylhydrolase [Candidatus Lokiarchaeota archaeon]MBD3200520.1 cellulase family glycosylhydrolase [Candidatus Lokiarchaeota archaeon]
MRLKINNEWFVDDNGRKVLLRGVNLGGSSKVPNTPNGATHIPTEFSSHRNVSFINRPFPINEAEEHFSRLKHWGFNCLRFLITWEAIEHEGPKKYDRKYINYLVEILAIAQEYGFFIFIDPHQDVWSRMSGGDGAPGWIFEKIGIDITKLDESEAAFTMQKRYIHDDPSSYPSMSWSSNAVRFINGTMWTLFFGGKDFAPSLKIDGVNIQDYLQDHYISSVLQIVKKLKDFPNIIGYDTLNEPEKGWIGKKLNGVGERNSNDYIGYVFTPFDAMITAAGFSREVGYNKVKGLGIKEIKREILNIDGSTCWINQKDDIWRNEGVWDISENENPYIKKNDHFTNVNGNKIDFHKDFLSPFIMKYTKEVRKIDP